MLCCCGEKKYNQYLQTCIIWDKSYRNASGGRVCVRGQTKRRAHWIYSWTFERFFSPVRPVALPISLQLKFWHRPFSYTFCMATYHLFYSGNKLFFRKYVQWCVFLRPSFTDFVILERCFCPVCSFCVWCGLVSC